MRSLFSYINNKTARKTQNGKNKYFSTCGKRYVRMKQLSFNLKNVTNSLV